MLVIFGSTVMMVLLPIVGAVTRTAISMTPFVHVMPPIGIFSLGSLTKLYFLLSLVHSIRIYRRMMHPEIEQNSYFEGSPLPFFNLLPRGAQFWVTRIVWEPVFVYILASMLGRLFIFQSGLFTYLHFAALCLAMKQSVAWYRCWQQIRDIMDMRFADPVFARMADNTATQDDLAQIHMASFPKHLPEDIRQAAVSHIAHEYGAQENS